jgi:hypothetical protein
MVSVQLDDRGCRQEKKISHGERPSWKEAAEKNIDTVSVRWEDGVVKRYTHGKRLSWKGHHYGKCQIEGGSRNLKIIRVNAGKQICMDGKCHFW